MENTGKKWIIFRFQFRFNLEVEKVETFIGGTTVIFAYKNTEKIVNTVKTRNFTLT